MARRGFDKAFKIAAVKLVLEDGMNFPFIITLYIVG
jgi:transposase-like protein